MRLLVAGNSKLGPGVWSWSLPAINTCPGASGMCKLACYATKNHYTYENVKARYRYNLERSKRADFATDMAEEIRRCRPGVVRIHTSGDIYDPEYGRKWLEIARKCPRTDFFLYSRSWRVPSILPVLREMAVESNVFLWLSEDAETGPPPPVAGARRAYMARPQDEAAVPAGCDLVFRTRDKPPAKRLNGALVCPWEQGVPRQVEKIGCSTCRICFSGPRPARRPTAGGLLVSLPIISFER